MIDYDDLPIVLEIGSRKQDIRNCLIEARNACESLLTWEELTPDERTQITNCSNFIEQANEAFNK